MNSDINAKLNSIISGMNQQDIQKLVQMTKSSGILSRLTPSDRQKILNEFSKMDTNQIKRKLSGINSSDLSKMSADELIKKLRGI